MAAGGPRHTYRALGSAAMGPGAASADVLERYLAAARLRKARRRRNADGGGRHLPGVPSAEAMEGVVATRVVAIVDAAEAVLVVRQDGSFELRRKGAGGDAEDRPAATGAVTLPGAARYALARAETDEAAGVTTVRWGGHGARDGDASEGRPASAAAPLLATLVVRDASRGIEWGGFAGGAESHAAERGVEGGLVLEFKLPALAAKAAGSEGRRSRKGFGMAEISLDLEPSGMWFGGAHMIKQAWPLNEACLEVGPYYPFDNGPNGVNTLCGNQWVTSAGLLVMVDADTPFLHVGMNAINRGFLGLRALRRAWGVGIQNAVREELPRMASWSNPGDGLLRLQARDSFECSRVRHPLSDWMPAGLADKAKQLPQLVEHVAEEEGELLARVVLAAKADTSKPMATPVEYTRLWVTKVAANFSVAEVRTGHRCTDTSILTRMGDRFSTWGTGNGLRSTIPTLLTSGVLGYPFVLPDIVGGNAYFGSSPDAELLVRWAQASALMPTVQFSIAPWDYDGRGGGDDRITGITRDALATRAQLASRLRELAASACDALVPIARPMWWLAPRDPNTWPIADQFAIGDDVVVAPVVTKGGRQRDIYLPEGDWLPGSDPETVIEGGRWLRDFPAPLEELPCFYRAHSVAAACVAKPRRP
eukprot:PRCOL_00007264-RA